MSKQNKSIIIIFLDNNPGVYTYSTIYEKCKVTRSAIAYIKNKYKKYRHRLIPDKKYSITKQFLDKNKGKFTTKEISNALNISRSAVNRAVRKHNLKHRIYKKRKMPNILRFLDNNTSNFTKKQIKQKTGHIIHSIKRFNENYPNYKGRIIPSKKQSKINIFLDNNEGNYTIAKISRFTGLKINTIEQFLKKHPEYQKRVTDYPITKKDKKQKYKEMNMDEKIIHTYKNIINYSKRNGYKLHEQTSDPEIENIILYEIYKKITDNKTPYIKKLFNKIKAKVEKNTNIKSNGNPFFNEKDKYYNNENIEIIDNVTYPLNGKDEVIDPKSEKEISKYVETSNLLDILRQSCKELKLNERIFIQRLIMNKTYEEIGEMEGKTKQAMHLNINNNLPKLNKKIRNKLR